MNAPATIRKAELAAPLTWMLFLSAALLVLLSEAVPLEMPALRPEGALTLFVQAEAFFLLLLWPLFLARPDASASVMWQLAVVLVLSLPLSFVAAGVAGAGPAAWVESRILVASVALVPAGFFLSPWAAKGAAAYFAAVLALSLGLPYAGFLGAPDSLAAAGSAFRAASLVLEPGWAAGVGACVAVHGAAGILLMLSDRLRGRRLARTV